VPFLALHSRVAAVRRVFGGRATEVCCAAALWRVFGGSATVPFLNADATLELVSKLQAIFVDSRPRNRAQARITDYFPL
ncbi:unnamed protein product, partial [Ixodes persulcatus]